MSSFYVSRRFRSDLANRDFDMKTYKKASTCGLNLLLAVIFSLSMIGCGSDGSDGATGPAGPISPPEPPVATDTPLELVVTVNSISISNQLTINFSLVNENGLAYVDLTAPRFMLAKLVPGTGGNSSRWQSYINQTEIADGNGPGTLDTIHAIQDRNGELINNNDGSYIYTFENDITNVTTPIPVTYEPDLTHRLAIQISGNEQPVTNLTYTWRPSDGATTGIFSRDIVKQETCNSCHGDLAVHGGGSKDPQMCVTCHNPGSIDANSGNTVDFSLMTHKIHYGENLPSVVDGGEYAIWGYRDYKHDYSDLRLSMDIRNCTKCHNEADTETADAANWHLVPTIESCGSCHDDIDFALGQVGGHEGGVMEDNSGCTICHSEGGFAGSVLESHQIKLQVAANAFKFNILDIQNTAPGEFPEVTFSVTDPESGDAAYNILADPEFTAAGGASRVAIDIAWSSTDYTNEGAGSGVANPVSINPLSTAIDNSDGTFTVNSTVAIPTDQTGSGAIGIEGHPAVDLDGDGIFSERVPVKGEVGYFAITDTDVAPRREIVSLEKCLDCHVNLISHGSNRNDSIELCVMCHNPSSTDLNRRPTSATDGLAEQTVDMKYMIHAIHASEKRENPYILYGFGGTEHDFSSAGYSGILNNCETCHLDGTYELPLATSVRATTIDSGADVADRDDDLKITATASVCSSCHDDPLSKAHMIQNGGASFNTSQQAIDDFDVVETCVFCHGPDNSEDVKKVHGIE